MEIADLHFDLSTLEAARAGNFIPLYPIYKKLLRILMEASPSIDWTLTFTPDAETIIFSIKFS